jgi:uncharacterized protein RhaS with RHS repeats
VRDVIDDGRAVLNHLVYNSFGQVTSESDPTVDVHFGYTGRELDAETDLMYYRARYFDPAAGIVWVRTRWDTFLSIRRRYSSAL